MDSFLMAWLALILKNPGEIILGYALLYQEITTKIVFYNYFKYKLILFFWNKKCNTPKHDSHKYDKIWPVWDTKRSRYFMGELMPLQINLFKIVSLQSYSSQVSNTILVVGTLPLKPPCRWRAIDTPPTGNVSSVKE